MERKQTLANKKFWLGLLAGFVSLVSFVSCEDLPISGDGNLVTSERTVSSFEKITVSGSAAVRFHVSQEYRAVVTVDSNLEEYTRVFTRENVLNIGTERGNYRFTKYLVDVYCPVVTGVSISGSGQFSGDDTLIASTFDTNISGSGKIDGTIECDTFSVKITGSGKVTVGGNSNDFSIDISGSGNFNGDAFTVKNAAIRISGSGKVNIGVTDNLKAKISGSGDLNYRGDPPVLESSVSGSGRIRKL